jgi:hypothetical protein
VFDFPHLIQPAAQIETFYNKWEPQSGSISYSYLACAGNCFLRIKKPAQSRSRRSGRVAYQSRQKSLKRAVLNAVYLVVCAIEACPNQA